MSNAAENTYKALESHLDQQTDQICTDIKTTSVSGNEGLVAVVLQESGGNEDERKHFLHILDLIESVGFNGHLLVFPF